MIVDLTKDINFKADYYLYWIRENSHKDMYTEGYIGITKNPKKRLSTHNTSLKNYHRNKKTYYSRDFVNSFNSEDLLFSIIDCGEFEYIRNKEYLLRPTERIGWNYAVGGNANGVCSNYKHGGTQDQPLYNKFNNLVNYCKHNGIYIDNNFLTDSGFKLFCLHMQDRCNGADVKNKSVGLVDEKLGFVCGNFYIEPTSKNSDHDNWVFFKDRWWSKVEACLENGVDVKTAEKRLTKYKMTREEAVGFVPFTSKCYETVYLDDIPCKYNNKLSEYSKEDLIKMYDFYKQEKRGFKEYCKSFGANSVNMLRYFKRYGLATNVDRRTKDFRGDND